MSKSRSNIAVLIVAGGIGTRMHSDIPKQYITVLGKSVIRRTVESFLDFPDISCVQCVIGEGQEELYQQSVEHLELPSPVIGGATRQESVIVGLKALERVQPDYILIHDAARPCFNPQDIHRIINKLHQNCNLTFALPVQETIRRNSQLIDRDNLWIMQTPQAFDYKTLFQLHQKAIDDNLDVTDDTSIMSYYGHPIEYINGDPSNIKITTDNDLKMVTTITRNTLETRVGSGFDVHAFSDHSAEVIRLCGIDIPYNRSLKGHSDADVGLHALTDAILGSVGDGDIGSHFPPSDAKFKNMDSHVFLDKSVDILKHAGGFITHIDITFMCEEPKIGKHSTEIKNHLASYLNLSTSRISVKATTTEKLGFLGRCEGVACQAIATVQVPIDA